MLLKESFYYNLDNNGPPVLILLRNSSKDGLNSLKELEESGPPMTPNIVLHPIAQLGLPLPVVHLGVTNDEAFGDDEVRAPHLDQLMRGHLNLICKKR